MERRALQCAVSVGCLVPILAGGFGMIEGVAWFSPSSPVDLDSHFRYLSGLLLAIGLGYASTIPRIERHSARVLLLTFLVLVGGVGRLFSLWSQGAPSAPMLAALAMELLVTPALALWQRRLARRLAE